MAVSLVCASALLMIGGCSMFGFEQTPQGTAQSAIASGNVNVHVRDRLAIVTGWVPDATTAQAVQRELLKRDDIDEVQLELHRDM